MQWIADANSEDEVEGKGKALLNGGKSVRKERKDEGHDRPIDGWNVVSENASGRGRINVEGEGVG